MDGNKKGSSSSSSFTSDLFGSEGNYAPPSSGIFGSIFSPSNKTLGRESLRSEENAKKQTYVNQGTNSKRNEGNIGSDETSPYYQPSLFSSSIYYGGQDVYSRPDTAQPGMINRDEGEDDSGGASRGNWWKGSLYY